jgi:hypothetical protein
MELNTGNTKINSSKSGDFAQLGVLLVLILFVPFISISQEKEYIVTNNNDTIYGKVIRGTNYFNPSKVIFKIKNEKGKKTLINPSEVKTIRSIRGIDGDCYISTIYDKWFIKKIINGRIKVYQLIGGVVFYVSKDDSKIVSTDIGWFFSGKKAHAQVRLLVEDNSEILKEFDSLKGSERKIMYIIEKYNNAEKQTIANSDRN